MTTKERPPVTWQRPDHVEAGRAGGVRGALALVREHPWVLFLVLVVIGTVIGWRFLAKRDGFENLLDGAFVKTAEDVRGAGPETALNRYLVEPQTFSRAKFVQAKLASHHWSVPVQFGEASTEDGTRFRVFVLVTTADLPVGKITAAVPQDASEFFNVTVTLKK